MMKLSLSHMSLKVWMGIVAVLVAIAVFLVITLLNIAPNVVVIAQLFSKDIMTFNELTESTNMLAQVKEKGLIDELLIRFYIENRNEYLPDKKELLYRWGNLGPVRRLSSPAVFKEFLAEKGNFIEKIEEQDDAFSQQSIPITSIDITHVERKDNTFIVDFDLFQNQDGVIVSAGSRKAVARIRNMPRSVRFDPDFSNPYGLTVLEYKETVQNKR